MWLGESMLLGALGGWDGIRMAGLAGRLGRGFRLSFAEVVRQSPGLVGMLGDLYCAGLGYCGRTGCRLSASLDIQCEGTELHIT
jgi:hypothetical protein